MARLRKSSTSSPVVFLLQIKTSVVEGRGCSLDVIYIARTVRHTMSAAQMMRFGRRAKHTSGSSRLG